MYVRVKEKYEERKENEDNISQEVEEDKNSTLEEDEIIRKEAKDFNGELGIIEYEYEDENHQKDDQGEEKDQKNNNGGVTHE